MSESERRNHLAEAGNNVLRVPLSRVRFDLFSDVPHRVLVPDAVRSSPEVDVDQVREALSPLTGGAHLTFATKGRAAENALIDALDLDGPPVVLTHGLFTTTQVALARRAAVVEDLPLAGSDGRVDVDLAKLDDRLARGGVHLVYLEVANNAWFGWPLTEPNLAAVRTACDRHGVKLLLDATRPLSNSAALDHEDLADGARRMLALAHAFTISCAKEFLVPIGSVIGSPDLALIARASQLLFKHGTSMCAIDPPQQRADLRDGVRYSLDHPTLIRDRAALAKQLAAALVERGVAIVQPVTTHAVFIPIDRALLAGEVPALITVLSHLYAVAGIRAQVSTTRRGPAIRLALALRTSLDAGALREIAAGIAEFFARLDERRHLRALDGELEVPYFRRFGML